MDIKEILENGGVIEFSYKEKSKEWVGTAKIYSVTGYFGMKPIIRIEVPTLSIKGSAEFDPDRIDDAISLFKNLVFSKKNLMWLQKKAVDQLYVEGYKNLDLEIEKDFKLVRKRQELLWKQEPY